jgi:hypothetical protein
MRKIVIDLNNFSFNKLVINAITLERRDTTRRFYH